MLEVFKKKWNWGLLLWFLAPIGIIGLYLIFLIYETHPISQYSIEKAGQLGDSFGVLNSLFSGFAFIALVITIYLQQKDIKDSKAEMTKKNFEQIFFDFIKIHNDLVASFRQIHERHCMYGDEAISYFLSNFKEGGTTAFYEPDPTKTQEDRLKERNLDPEVLAINLSIKLGRSNLKFIETVYLILNLIARAENLNDIDKKFYLETLHAQISDEELALIFYYTHGIKSDMKSVIEEYHFFENINEQLLRNWEEEIKLYDENLLSVIQGRKRG